MTESGTKDHYVMMYVRRAWEETKSGDKQEGQSSSPGTRRQRALKTLPQKPGTRGRQEEHGDTVGPVTDWTSQITAGIVATRFLHVRVETPRVFLGLFHPTALRWDCHGKPTHQEEGSNCGNRTASDSSNIYTGTHTLEMWRADVPRVPRFALGLG